jgi:hypothetical protein
VTTLASDAVAQLNVLLDAYQQQRRVAAEANSFTPLAEIRAMVTRFQAAIARLTAPSSTYAKSVDRLYNMMKIDQDCRPELAGIVTALRDDIQAGWLESVIELAHADTYEGYLEMAEGLASQGYKDAAAVIAGTSLEVHLKTLASKYGVDISTSGGGPKKADTLNSDLRKADVYNALEQKSVTTWLGIRNSAAHGHYDEYDMNRVVELIKGVRDFAIRYPA